MSMAEKVREVLAEEVDRQHDPEFRKLRDFYDAKKQEGAVTKQEYSLPPVDTIGRTLFLDRRSEQ